MADFTTPLTEALQPLQDSEAPAIAHMNADHGDAVRLIATRLSGGADGAWELVGLDPDGIDLRLDGTNLRYMYAEPLEDAGELRSRLVAITRQSTRISRQAPATPPHPAPGPAPPGNQGG